jgi:SAM-dependent methyltransferase
VPDERPSFDEFQPYYDLMVDWERRLAHEAPFLQRVLARAKARRVLDCACGTGRHARLLARWGLEVEGTDLAPAMVRQARQAAAAEGASARFAVADFTELADSTAGRFDAVLCTGNSLPLAGSADRVRRAVAGMHRALVPRGIVLIQCLNYARLPEGVNVYRGPRARLVEDREVLFLKVFRKVGRTCDLDIVVLEKRAAAWTKLESRARAWALEQPELELLATEAGFGQLQWYGGYEAKPFDPGTSEDLILVARREK